MTERRTVGVKLDEDRIAALNLKLKNDGFAGFSDFVNFYIDGSAKLNDSAADLIAEKVVQRLYKNENYQPMTVAALKNGSLNINGEAPNKSERRRTDLNSRPTD